MPPLKILHIATHTGVFRGGAVQACRMAEGLARRGHSVTLLAAEDSAVSPEMRARHARTWDPLRACGVHVATMNYDGRIGAFRLRRFIKQENFDIVHAHRDDALLAASRILSRRRRPALVAQRGTISRPPATVAKAFKSDRVRAVVAVAQAVKRSLVRHTRADSSKVHVVYGSVDLEKFAPRDPDPERLRRAGFPEGSFVVGSLSAFRKAKGFDYLLTALDRAIEAAPDIRGLFLGANVERKVRPLLEGIQHQDHLRFVGHRPDVANWIACMDLTVMAATDREGLSGVLRESLAMGVPVISTDCAGNREIVQDRKTGLLVPPGDSDALRDALLWAHDHPEEMRTMAEAGRAWVQQHCCMEKQCESLEEIYRSVLD